MKRTALLLLRISLGLLLVIWGVDKLRNVQHGLVVSERFYGGLFSSTTLMVAFGVLELLLGLGVALGALRRITYLGLLAVTGTTLLAVWRSVVDPLGLVLENTQLLFYPSAIIFCGALVLWAFRDEDSLAIDRARRHA